MKRRRTVRTRTLPVVPRRARVEVSGVSMCFLFFLSVTVSFVVSVSFPFFFVAFALLL